MVVRALAALLAASILAAPAAAADGRSPFVGRSFLQAATLTEREATSRALAVPKVRDWLERYPPRPTTAASFDAAARAWTVKVWSGEAGQIALVELDDASGAVTEAWTGPQVAWRMARGGEASFGGRVLNDPWVWLAYSAVFFLGLANLRRPLSLRNLDLVALLAFTASLFAFNDANIFASVPLAYPPLVYLLARTAAIGFRGRREALPQSAWPVWLLAAVAVFLTGFKVGLNVAVSGGGVIDVGYAGVIGAQRILDGEAPYGHMPVDDEELEPCGKENADGEIRDRIQTNGRCESSNRHGDTYGPLSYVAYVPAVALLGWSGKWDSLPAAHLTAILMDVLAFAAMALVGRRFGDARLAATLAFAWAAYPFTAYVLNANSNDAIMPALLLLGFLALAAPVARGASVAAAGWTKFGALLAAPLWLTYPDGARRGRVTRFAVGFGVVSALALSVLLLEPSLVDAVSTFLDRSVGFQLERNSPFSLWDWGQYHADGIPDLGVVQIVLEVAVVAFCGVVAVLPRRKGPLQLAALTAAVLLGFQLVLTHWFYLYLPWVLPFVILALFLPRPEHERPALA